MDDESHHDCANQTMSIDGKTIKRKLEEASKTPASMVIVFGKPLGKRFLLESDENVVGRGPGCTISINSNSISRTHARISRNSAGQFFIKDLDSTNGTYLKERRLLPQEPCALEDGHLVRLGNIILKFLAHGSVDNVLHADVLSLATLDDLTGIYNRKSITDALEDHFNIAKMGAQPFSVVLFDIDDFKSINDRFGHIAGDSVLREIPKPVKIAVRTQDHFGRFGGDEFLILLAETSISYACIIAERVRARVEKHSFMYEGKRIRVTVSVGVASLDFSFHSATKLLMAADEAHYKAKKSGGNRMAAHQCPT